MSVNKLLEYIEQNIKEKITLVELSELIHYSPRQVYYMIKKETGMPVMNYIRYRRLLRAAGEIAQGRKLFDVAVDYGFETQAGFYKAFLLQIGCSPKEYQYHEQLHYARKNHPAFQNQGLETRLFQEVCKEAIEMGFECVTTTCRGDGTEQFYKSLGMQEGGRIPNGIYEPWGEHNKYDEIILMKELK